MAAIPTTITAVSLTNGVATQLTATSIFASSVILFADNLNTGNIYWGGSNVTVSNGIPIAKNQSENVTYDLVLGGNSKIDLSKIYLDCDTSGNKVRVLYIPWSNA